MTSLSELVGRGVDEKFIGQQVAKNPNSALLMRILSGGFAPPTDCQGRIHRLSRLTVATMMKGDWQKEDGDLSGLYSPSWADGSSALVYTGRACAPYSLSLIGDMPGSIGESSRVIHMSFMRYFGRDQMLEIRDNDAPKSGREQRFPVGTQREVKIAMYRAAEFAQRFYDDLAISKQY